MAVPARPARHVCLVHTRGVAGAGKRSTPWNLHRRSQFTLGTPFNLARRPILLVKRSTNAFRALIGMAEKKRRFRTVMTIPTRKSTMFRRQLQRVRWKPGWIHWRSVPDRSVAIDRVVRRGVGALLLTATLLVPTFFVHAKDPVYVGSVQAVRGDAVSDIARGTVFLDADRDSRLDLGEKGIPSVLVSGWRGTAPRRQGPEVARRPPAGGTGWPRDRPRRSGWGCGRLARSPERRS